MKPTKKIQAPPLHATCTRTVAQDFESHLTIWRATESSSAAPTITWIEAKCHVGKDVAVSGRVTGLYIASQTTNVYMYFDGDDIFHPKFAVVWPGTNDPPVKKFEALIYKAISVRGKITIETNLPNHCEFVVTAHKPLDTRRPLIPTRLSRAVCS